MTDDPTLAFAPMNTPDPLARDAAPDEAAPAWVARLASGETSVAEVLRLRAWLAADPANQLAFERARGLWAGLDELETAIRPAPRPQTRRILAAGPSRRRALIGGAIAAAVAASLALFVALPEDAITFQTPDYRTGAGKIARFVLPDGTVAWLDTDSAIDLDYSLFERRVELLRGQAWFEVAHNKDRPFSVAALDGEATATGTSFGVRREATEVEVVVTTGNVRVEWQGQRVALTAGQKASWGERAPLGAPVAFNPDSALAWRQGRLFVDGKSLDEALAEIGRYIPERILLLDSAAGKKPVSGMLYIDRLDEGIDALAASQGMSVTRLPYLTVLRAAAAPKQNTLQKNADQGG
jgi:transmembrane sensor